MRGFKINKKLNKLIKHNYMRACEHRSMGIWDQVDMRAYKHESTRAC